MRWTVYHFPLLWVKVQLTRSATFAAFPDRRQALFFSVRFSHFVKSAFLIVTLNARLFECVCEEQKGRDSAD